MMHQRPWITISFAFLLTLLVGPPTYAHEIPNDVMIHVFFKPEGQRLNVLIRIPLSAMRDVDYPRRGDTQFADLSQIDPSLRNAANLWIASGLTIYEENNRLPDPTIAEVRASLQSDRSMSSYEEALAHVMGPRLPDSTEFTWDQGLLDVLFYYPIQSDRSRFSIEPDFNRLGLRTLTVLRFLPPGEDIRGFEFGGNPGLVRLDPRWHQAAFHFVQLGFEHILDGIDHLLFLFCLVIPFRQARQLILVVTSFTVAHSVTLIASAYNLAPTALWFPPFVETVIAMSIVYMALENIVGSKVYRRWIITFGFGLIHGFGFSFALHETLQFAGSHMVTSLLAFNIGVEFGQLLVLLLLVPLLDLLFRHVVDERIGTIIVSALVAHTAWHWMLERGSTLGQFSFEWPEVTASLLLTVIRWLMLLVLAAGLVWLLSLVSRPKQESDI